MSSTAMSVSTSQSEIYTIDCIVAGEASSFPVEIANNKTVGILKEMIQMKKQAFANIDADKLQLYKVDISGSKQARMQELKKIAGDLDKKEELDETRKLAKIYPDLPPEETVHILVQPPQLALAGVKRKLEDGDEDNVKPQLIFLANKRGVFSLELNEIYKADRASPLPNFVRKIVEDLGKTRDIMNKETTVKFHLSTEDTRASFTDNSTKPLNAQESNEFVHFQTVLVHDPLRDSYRDSREQFFHYRFLFEVEQYLRRLNDTTGFKYIAFEQRKSWGFALVAKIKPVDQPSSGTNVIPDGQASLVEPDDLFYYSPQSDWQLKVHNIPCLHIEVSSDPIKQKDRGRMLIQASCLVRMINAAQGSTNEPNSNFVDVCIYIDNDFSASRYLVYQPNAGNRKIEYTMREFDLTKAHDRAQFLTELYNFPSVTQAWDLENLRNSDYFKTARELGLNQGFTSKRQKTETTQSNNSHNQAPPGGRYGDPSVEERLSQSGYHLIKDIDLPDWKPLNPLKSTLCKAKRSDGKLVMLKLVERDSDEVAIHKMLNAIKSQFNHTISLLDEVVFEFGTIIAVPYAIVLPLLSNVILIKYCHDLARQFLEGVAFMHDHLVAHLDLKPDNLVVTGTQTSPRILIIDFGTSVQVHSREDVITGYRGTAGWVAPEVGWHDAPDQVFSPINADLWASGKMVKWFCSHLQRSCPQETLYLTQLATELMDEEPQKRPLLTLPLLLQLQLQPVKRGVKRKLKTLDSRRKQRIRTHSDRQYAV